MGDHRGSPGAVYFLHFHRPHIHKLFYSLFLDNTAMLVSFFYYTTLNLPTDYICFLPTRCYFFLCKRLAWIFCFSTQQPKHLCVIFVSRRRLLIFLSVGTHSPMVQGHAHTKHNRHGLVFFSADPTILYLSHKDRSEACLHFLFIFSLTPRTSVCV